MPLVIRTSMQRTLVIIWAARKTSVCSVGNFWDSLIIHSGVMVVRAKASLHCNLTVGALEASFQTSNFSAISHNLNLNAQLSLITKRNLRDLILEDLFIPNLKLCFPSISGKLNWVRGFHRPSKMKFLTLRLHIHLECQECTKIQYAHIAFIND